MNNFINIILILSLVNYYITKGTIRYIGIIFLVGILGFLFFRKNKDKDVILDKIKNDNSIMFLFFIPIIYYVSHCLIVYLFNKTHLNHVMLIKEISYVFIPLLLIKMMDLVFNEKDKVIDYVFYSIVIAFLLQSVVFNINYIITNLFNPNRPFGLFENHILTQALVYYFLYYLYTKNNKNAIISLVLIVMGNKRVVYMGALLCIIPLIIINIKKLTNTTKVWITGIYIVLVQCMYVLSIRLGILQHIVTSLGINDMHRFGIWHAFYDDYNLKLSFLGDGVGFVYDKLAMIGNEWYPYLYNEPLKYLIELGIVGFIIFAILKLLPLFKMTTCNSQYLKFIILSFTFFTGVVFMDNLNFYQEYVFLFFAIINFSYLDYLKKNNTLN